MQMCSWPKGRYISSLYDSLRDGKYEVLSFFLPTMSAAIPYASDNTGRLKSAECASDGMAWTSYALKDNS